MEQSNRAMQNVIPLLLKMKAYKDDMNYKQKLLDHAKDKLMAEAE